MFSNVQEYLCNTVVVLKPGRMVDVTFCLYTCCIRLHLGVKNTYTKSGYVCTRKSLSNGSHILQEQTYNYMVVNKHTFHKPSVHISPMSLLNPLVMNSSMHEYHNLLTIGP